MHFDGTTWGGCDPITLSTLPFMSTQARWILNVTLDSPSQAQFQTGLFDSIIIDLSGTQTGTKCSPYLYDSVYVFANTPYHYDVTFPKDSSAKITFNRVIPSGTQLHMSLMTLEMCLFNICPSGSKALRNLFLKIKDRLT